ncbi:hypothetical protein JOM56_015453 [Amanita muscaria]
MPYGHRTYGGITPPACDTFILPVHSHVHSYIDTFHIFLFICIIIRIRIFTIYLIHRTTATRQNTTRHLPRNQLIAIAVILGGLVVLLAFFTQSMRLKMSIDEDLVIVKSEVHASGDGSPRQSGEERDLLLQVHSGQLTIIQCGIPAHQPASSRRAQAAPGELHAVVAGQTSVKAPERDAFEKHLLISFPVTLYMDQTFLQLDSLCMGTAWAVSQSYPWEQGLYVGGLETAKVNLTLRIYSNQWHMYAGLAILNPNRPVRVRCLSLQSLSRTHVKRYAKSATELFKLMLAGGNGTEEDKKAFGARVEWGGKVIFGLGGEKKKRRPISLSEDVLDRLSSTISVATTTAMATTHKGNNPPNTLP